MMFNYGERVCPKKCGLPTIGRVVGSMVGHVWAAHMPSGQRNLTYWDILYPGWRTQAIIFVKFDKPQKPMTVEEYRQTLGPEVEEHEAKVLYRYNLSKLDMCCYPAADLERMDAEDDKPPVEDEVPE